MTSPVLLDTSFLISLLNSNRPNHSVAEQYYRLLLAAKSPIYFSSIVAAEIAIKQPITDLPLKDFRMISFNIPHAIEAAKIWTELRGVLSEQSRSVARDDVKLMAQAIHENIPFILTEDASTLYNYCERIRVCRKINFRAIKLIDGFDVCALRLDGQKGLDLAPFSDY